MPERFHNGTSELEHLAREVMQQRDEKFAGSFVNIVLFSRDNPDLAVQFRGKNPPEFGSREHLERLADKYLLGMAPKPLLRPKTVPDPALSIVMIYGYQVDPEEIDTQIDGHRWAMVAENVVGDLLERYIDRQIDTDDWIWCAGEVVKRVDFIRRSSDPDLVWESLQIKNRDNSENSSSSAIREGTNIKKWHRTVSRTGQTRWDAFPVGAEADLSEEGFREFIVEYMNNLPEG